MARHGIAPSDRPRYLEYRTKVWELQERYSTKGIGRYLGVSERTVRSWAGSPEASSSRLISRRNAAEIDRLLTPSASWIRRDDLSWEEILDTWRSTCESYTFINADIAVQDTLDKIERLRERSDYFVNDGDHSWTLPDQDVVLTLVARGHSDIPSASNGVQIWYLYELDLYPDTPQERVMIGLSHESFSHAKMLSATASSSKTSPALLAIRIHQNLERIIVDQVDKFNGAQWQASATMSLLLGPYVWTTGEIFP